MGTRNKGGLIGGFDQLRAPDAPTISVTAGSEQVSVAFTNPSDVGGGAITSYTATAIASGVSTGATSASSPVVITGLSNGTSYSVTGLANNAFGSSPYSAATSSSPALNQRGLFAGGRTSSSYTNFISYITITSTGNSTEFGDLLTQNRWMAGCASSTRGIFAGGYTSTNLDVIQYVTILTTGNATDFGDLTVARNVFAGLSNSTRGVFAGGVGYMDTIDYITIASTGNATDFGNLTTATEKCKGCASTTRGLISGGEAGGYYIVTIEYVTIASTGNATDFGDLLSGGGRAFHATFSSSTRGIVSAGGGESGGNRSDVIQYVTIASTGNATDFGDLLAANHYCIGLAGSTRGIVAGGETSGGISNVIQYVTIASTGNATDFGDLDPDSSGYGLGSQNMAACSNAHGGI